MNNKKIIAVVVATGTQGGGLVRAILEDPQGEFTVRALTRNVHSEKAEELKRLGVEVVAADVKHVIWSSLDDTRKWIPLDDDRMPTLLGKYKVPHFDAKGEANHYFLESGVPTTILNTVFYWDNFIYFGLGPQKGPDGRYAITFPLGNSKMPGIAAGDIGKCALSIFKGGDKYIGKTVGIAGEHISGKQMAASFTKVLGKEVVYNDIPPEVYRSFDFPGAEDMGNMFQFKRDFEKEYCESRSIEVSRSLNPSLLSFDQWLEMNKGLLKLD